MTNREEDRIDALEDLIFALLDYIRPYSNAHVNMSSQRQVKALIEQARELGLNL